MILWYASIYLRIDCDSGQNIVGRGMEKMGKITDGVDSAFKGLKTVIKLLVLVGIVVFIGRAAYILLSDHSVEAGKVAGTYKSVSFFNTGINLNEDGTYDHYEDNELVGHGTFEATKKSLNLYSNKEDVDLGSFRDSTYFEKQGDYYYMKRDGMQTVSFSQDSIYGQPPSFDENGRCDQTFGSMDDIYLVLLEDGTYSLTILSQEDWLMSGAYMGNYTLDGKILKLSYDGGEFVFIYDNDEIYFDVYEKQE